MKQPEEIRKILDPYKERYSKNFWYCLAEGSYWYDKDEKRGKHWYSRANKAAGNSKLRKLYVLGLLAGKEGDKSDFGDAIRLYHQIVKLDPEDPWAWHNLSYMYLKLGKLDEADECNQRALSIMEFGVARMIENNIKLARQNPIILKLKNLVGYIIRLLTS